MLITPEIASAFGALVVALMTFFAAWLTTQKPKAETTKAEDAPAPVQSDALWEIATTLREMLAIYRERR